MFSSYIEFLKNTFMSVYYYDVIKIIIYNYDMLLKKTNSSSNIEQIATRVQCLT